ncbi:MAG: nitrogenase component 1 [Spirochaetota bacterium]
MRIDLNLPEAEPRERRLGGILSFKGKASELHQKSLGCRMKMQDRTFSQNGSCSSAQAYVLISTITDGVVVNHAPIGCSGDFILYNNYGILGAMRRGLKPENTKSISSNIEEKDTIYGGIEKLKKAAREAKNRYNPKAIFVNTSCASGIIGDDIESVANELEAELGIPIVSVYCDGFRSKIWSTGFDDVAHGIMRKLVKPPKKKSTEFVNVFNFQGSHSFDGILGKIGLKPKYLFPFSSVKDLEEMSEAVASTHICETLGTYIAAALEKEYGVPELKSPVPFGLDWTDEWLRELGRIINKSELVEKVIKEEHERIQPKLNNIKNKLSGIRAYILAGDCFAHSLVSVARSLGVEVIGVTGFHHDQVFDNDYEEANSIGNMCRFTGDVKSYTVSNRQPYQYIHLLKKFKPDVLITRHGENSTVGSKLGIPSFIVGDVNIYGAYDGIIEMGNKILQTLRMKKFYDNIAKHCELPYTDWWFQQDPFLFEKGERKCTK